MAASVPVTEIPDTVTVLFAPAFLVSNVEEEKVTLSTSPETRSLVRLTDADVVRSYVLSLALAVMTSVRSEILAVAEAVVFDV